MGWFFSELLQHERLNVPAEVRRYSHPWSLRDESLLSEAGGSVIGTVRLLMFMDMFVLDISTLNLDADVRGKRLQYVFAIFQDGEVYILNIILDSTRSITVLHPVSELSHGAQSVPIQSDSRFQLPVLLTSTSDIDMT